MENTDSLENINTEEAQTDTAGVEVVVTINQRDMSFTGDQLGVDMETSDAQVLTAVKAAVEEQIEDAEGNFTFAVRRATNTNKVYVYPKSTFG